MAFEFRPAVRDKTSVLIALSGPSGCGKTFTAILMAMGLAYPNMTPAEIEATIEREGKPRVYFIDSEGSRGLHYAPGPDQRPNYKDTFPYLYAEITAPYTPEAYQEAIEAADKAGAWVIIVDSMSHEYESEGGILEIADQYEAGIPKAGVTNPRDPKSSDGWKDWEVKPDSSAGKWKVPKTRHKKMVNRAIQARAHVIFCLRAEDKMLMEQQVQLDDNGNPRMYKGKPVKKSVVIPAGDRPLLERWHPICEKRFMYEMTVSFLLLPDRPGFGIPIKTLQGAFKDIFAQDGKLLGLPEGTKLAEWSMGRAKSAINARPPGSGEGDNAPSRASESAPSSPPSSSQGAAQQPTKTTRTPREMFDAYHKGLMATQTMIDMMEWQQKSAQWIERMRLDHADIYNEILDANSAHKQLLESTSADDDEREELFEGETGND